MKLLVLGCLLLACGLLVPAWLLLSPEQRPPGNAAPAFVPSPLVAVDSSGRGQHGVNQGRPVLGLPGYDGTAYSFDRRGSWIRVPSAPWLNPGRRDFMVSAWVNFDVGPKPGETYDVVRKGLSYTSSGEYKMEVLDGGQLKCSAKDSRARSASVKATVDVTDGQWHNIACVRTGNVWSAVVDETVESEVVTLGSIGNDLPLSLGSKYGLEDAPHGRVDELKVVLGEQGPGGTSDTVSSRIAGLRKAHPVGWWRLDEVRGREGEADADPGSDA